MMKQHRLSAMSHTAFGLIYFCCFSTTFFWQVSSQEHRPANTRNVHNEDKLSAMYASRGATNSSPIRRNQQGIYRPNSPNEAQNVLPIARAHGHIKQDSNPRHLDSSKVGHQSFTNKRVLDSIASDIIKRDMKTGYLRPFAFDVDSHADSNFQDMHRADMYPQSASALPDVLVNYEYSNYPLYDMTPDREAYSPFGHSNNYEETGFHHNDNPEFWYEREYPHAQPKTSEHSRMIKFNDTFNHHFINENTNGANGGILGSTTGELIKKDILDKYEGNTNNARYNSDLSNSFVRNGPNFLDNSFDTYAMESDFHNSDEHTVPSPDMTQFERANGQNYVDRLSQDFNSNKVRQSNSDILFNQGNYEENARNDISDSEMEDDLYLLTKGTKHNSHHFEPFFSGNIPTKRYLDGIASSLIKKNDGEKRYLDGIASSLIKKDDGGKRYLDGIASSLIKKDDGEKRYLDGIASSLIKKDDGEKRHLDGIASSLIKKDDGEKRYLDGIASSLIKKDDGEKRYLDGIASSLIKKDDGEKRYLDGIASSLIKKDDGEKRYLDGIASSLIKKDDGEKRYLDGIASSLIKKEDGGKRYLDGIASSLIKKYGGVKRYLDGIASSLIKKDDGEKRYLDGIASSLIKKDDGEKRYLDGIASSLIKKDDGEKRYLDGIASSLIKKDDGQKRYLDGIASSLIKRDDGEKRYLDGIASSLIKKDDGEKRYLDGIASSLIKKDDGEKRYLDGIASSLIKKDDGEKRYLDGIASSLIKKDDGQKRYLDGIASSLIKKDDGEKRYLDGIASSLIKKDDGEKRYLDGIASSLIKKDDGEKRYLDGIASSLIKKDDGKKRYLDGIASSLIKKDDGEKRYLDGIASSLIKKDDGEKRYLDGIASSLFKKDDGEKRYLDGIASSLIKKDYGEKRYLDGIASSLIKKDDGKKRYLDGIASSLIKKDDGEKRYLDGIASSLIKKDDGEKRYLDGIASSLIKKDDGEKRYLDGIASSLIKKDDGEKRYLDGIASSLIKKDDGEKRYLDGIASSLIKKDDGEKRYLDGIASSLIKKDDGEKRYLDGIASSLIKKDDGEKRYLDGIASSLIKKDDGEKRYLDGIASSLIKKDDGEKRYLDGIASSLIKKDDGEKRYLDGIASSLIKKDDGEKRYLDGIASSLIKKDDGEKRYLDSIAGSVIKKDNAKRYLDGIASSLIKKDTEDGEYFDSNGGFVTKNNQFNTKESSKLTHHEGYEARVPVKRMFEVTDDVMDGSKVVGNGAFQGLHSRRRRDTGIFDSEHEVVRDLEVPSVHRQKRFIDGIASSVLYKRFGLDPRSLSKHYHQHSHQPSDDELSEKYKNSLRRQRLKSKQRYLSQHKDALKPTASRQDKSMEANKLRNPSFDYMPERHAENNKQVLEDGQAIVFSTLVGNPGKFRAAHAQNDAVASKFYPMTSSSLGQFQKASPVYSSPVQLSLSNSAQKHSFTFGQVLPSNFYKSSQHFIDPIRYFKNVIANSEQDRAVKRFSDKYKKQNLSFIWYINKRLQTKINVAFDKISEDPNIDEIAAKIFKNNPIFKNPYINELAAAYFHSKYMISMTSNSDNTLGTDSCRTTSKLAKNETRSNNIINLSKKFDILSINKSKERYDSRNAVANAKQYIISSFVNRLPAAGNATLHTTRQISADLANCSNNFLAGSIKSRFRSISSLAGYRTTQLAIPSETWAGSQAASNTDPESWKSYPSPALKSYVRDMARRILARSRYLGQRLQPGSKYEIDNSDRDLSDKTNSRWKQKNSNSRDFFDEIAGDLLA